MPPPSASGAATTGSPVSGTAAESHVGGQCTVMLKRQGHIRIPGGDGATLAALECRESVQRGMFSSIRNAYRINFALV